MGFDDTPESGYFLPALTTVRQDFGEVGRRSVARLLLTLVDGEPVERHLVVPAELVVPPGTAPPHAENGTSHQLISASTSSNAPATAHDDDGAAAAAPARAGAVRPRAGQRLAPTMAVAAGWPRPMAS